MGPRSTPLAALLALALLALGAATGSAAEEDAIAVELNRADALDAGCRLSFVIHNDTPHSFTSLQWDLVGFDSDGLIADRMAAEVAPLLARKTSVKQFDIPTLGCDRLGRLLLNDITQCQTRGGDATLSDPLSCLRLIRPSSRTNIEFFK